MQFIFDLDHTTIDASHRGALDRYGRGDLDKWVALSTPENIAKDKALPLANEWRKLLRKGVTVVICTSRVISHHDTRMLRGHGLGWHRMLSRPEGDMRPAYKLKRELLSTLPGGWRQVCRTSVMYDDDFSVIRNLTRDGLKVYDAVSLNEWLKGANQ